MDRTATVELADDDGNLSGTILKYDPDGATGLDRPARWGFAGGYVSTAGTSMYKFGTR